MPLSDEAKKVTKVRVNAQIMMVMGVLLRAKYKELLVKYDMPEDTPEDAALCVLRRELAERSELAQGDDLLP